MKHRKLFTSVLSMALAAGTGASTLMSAVSIPVFAETANIPGYGDNMAVGRTAVASSQEANSVRASLATDGNSTDHDSRWGSAVRDNAEWIYVDLGEAKPVGAVRIFWENRKATAYSIQTANENPDQEASWTDRKVFNSRPASTTDFIEFGEAVTARYVRLLIPSHTKEDPDGGIAYNTVSIYEMEIYGAKDGNYQDPAENVARGKTAVSSSDEASNLTAANVTDGVTENIKQSGRWASARGAAPHWVYVDLGKMMDVNTVRIYWETRKATDYKIQTAADGADLSSADAWTTQKTLGRPSSTLDTIQLDSKVQARYVRVLVDAFDETDPDDSTQSWDTVSIIEVEVYGGSPASNASAADIAEAITIGDVTADTTKLPVNLPEVDETRFSCVYNGTDLEQIVDKDLNIHKPLVDKQVKVSFKVTDLSTKAYQFKEIAVTIPGQYSVETNDNTAPAILPELQEWKGHTGSFSITENTSVYYASDSFADAANALKEDCKDMTGKDLTVAKADSASAPAGSIVFTSVNDEALGKEGYLMNIGDSVEIKAADPTGAYWATRTLLQAVMVSADGSIPQGETRDYPTVATRSFMLDVGRKTFSMDYLKQMVKAMSWFKYNDFQIHLNDNYIWVNEYWHVGENSEDRRLQDVYSGFRMESDIKKGGNEGKNQEDLTAKDVFYTKAEFKDFINESKKLGITIVPEFDMPAHALAMTKVRPDLASPDSDLPGQTVTGNRSSADHLDLNHQFEDVMSFVKDIWDEYITGDDVIFDTPIIHIGADEYEAGAPAYRKYVNEMFNYAESNGYKARVWGSLSQLKNGDEVLGYTENADGSISRRQIDIWNTVWAKPKDMYDLGFELINIVDGLYYIVPNATHYYDYLNDDTMYNGAVNTIAGVTIPLGDEQMTGASFAIWNDMCFDRDNGMSEYDIYKRIIRSLGLFGANLWGKGSATLTEAKARTEILNNVPGTNFGYEVETRDGAITSLDMDSDKDTAGPGFDLDAGAAIEKVNGRNVLKVDGEHTASIKGLETAGLNNSLRVKVKRTSDSKDDQILFESGYGSIKAVQGSTGKVGFTRENRDYSFNYELPVGEWTELEFRNEFEFVSLYVNGQLVDRLGDSARAGLKATVMFPVKTIGSSEHPFIGYMDDIRLGSTKEFNSTANLDRKLEIAASLNLDGSMTALIDEGYSLSGQYDPSKKDLDNMMSRLDAALDNLDYEKADYSDVDAYLALVPKNTDRYTADSVAKLNTAVNAVNRSLPYTMQENVDTMSSNLHAALAGLTVRTDRDILKADQSKMTAAASSFESDDEDNKPQNAIDGDPSTIWHCDWDNKTLPHWLDIEFDSPETISEILYTPRSGGGNGTATAYTIQVSDDGTTYKDVKSGTLASDGTVKTIALDEPVTAKHVKFVITAATGSFGSCAEINFRLGNVTPATDELKDLIAAAEGLNEGDYTPVTWSAMQAELTAAKASENSTDPVAVDNSISALTKSISAMIVDYIEDQETLDYTLLNVVIDDITDAKVNALSASDDVTKTLSSAKALLSKARNQKQIDNKTEVLHAKWLAARNTPVKEKLDDLK